MNAFEEKRVKEIRLRIARNEKWFRAHYPDASERALIPGDLEFLVSIIDDQKKELDKLQRLVDGYRTTCETLMGADG